VYTNQSGALNESISDVFGSLVKQYAMKQTADQADWLIGAGLFLDNGKVQGSNGQPPALRSMKAPGTAYTSQIIGNDPQPATMSGYVDTAEDNGGVHTNSGIPNHAFYLVASALGGNAWERAGQIWYDTIQDKQLSSTANFVQFAGQTAINATHRFGNNSAEYNAVVAAWTKVGVQI
jgi:Zn-dependent metalloprotease